MQQLPLQNVIGVREKKRQDRKILSLKNQHRLFIREGVEDYDDDDEQNQASMAPRETGKKDNSDITNKFFLRLFYRAQVQAQDVWQIYKDGRFYKQLQSGPHVLWNWNIIFGKWQVLRVNLQTVLLTALVDGRVQGPYLPHINEKLGLNVTAEFRLTCKIANIEKFLSFKEPLRVFYASFNDMVNELLGKLPYDQYGEWAVTLRNQVEKRLKNGPNDSLHLIGMSVEQAFADLVPAGNETRDREVLALFQTIEKARREMEEARSLTEQGSVLKIPPSILALQQSPIGMAVLQHDTDLRRLMIAVGMNPGVIIQPVQEQPSFPSPQQSPLLPQPPDKFLPYPGSLSSPDKTITVSGNLVTSAPLPYPDLPIPPEDSPVSLQRKSLELAELSGAGFIVAGKGQDTLRFSAAGQPVDGSIEWTLEVYVRRTNSYLAIVFRCPSGYPESPPLVQIKQRRDADLKEAKPNTIENWHPGMLLVEVAREISVSMPE